MGENDHFPPESWATENIMMNHKGTLSPFFTAEEEMSQSWLLVHLI